MSRKNGYDRPDAALIAVRLQDSRQAFRFPLLGRASRLREFAPPDRSVKFSAQIAWVKFIGTHAEYDKIDALTVAQF
jgi:hypothetical protein